MFQPGSALPGPRKCPHQAVLSLEGSWQAWEHPTCCSPKSGTVSCQQQDSLSPGAVLPTGFAQASCQDWSHCTGRFALISQSPLYTTPGKLHGPEYLTQCINPSWQREPPDCPTHSAKLACLFLGVFVELRISPYKITRPYSFSSFPNPARHTCMCVPPAYQPLHDGHQCLFFSTWLGPAIISSSHGLALQLCMLQASFTGQSHFKIHHPSPDCWWVCQRQKTLAAGVVGGQRPFPVSVTQTGHGLSQWFTVHSKHKSQFLPDYFWM